MKLSIVIATYQRCALLQRTFPTVLGQDAGELEIVVVVDGSEDGTAEYLRSLRSPRVHVVEQENQGPGGARNAGVARATGEIILFLDDDLICPPDLARRHREAHQRGDEPKVVCGKVEISEESPQSAAVQIAREETALGYEKEREAGQLEFPTSTLVDANSSLLRSVFLSAGGFDASFRRSETNELGFRLHRERVRFESLPGTSAFQIFQKTSKQMCADAASHGHVEVRLARRFPEYRPFCAPAALGEERRGKRFARKILASRAARLIDLDVFDSAKVLRLRRSAAMWHAANEEAAGWTNLVAEFGCQLPVLLYHHVGPLRPGSPAGMSIPAQMFEEQLRWLEGHGYTAVTPSDWVAWVKGVSKLPERPVLLTFDDALEDLAVYAFPLLAKFNMKAICYAVTGKLGGMNDWAGIQTGHERLMTAQQLKQWSASGIEFGAHTRTHPDLRSLSDDELETEIGGSKADLEDILGKRVTSFAYTYGDYNEAAVECARRHFDCSFTTDEGVNSLRTDLHLLRRTMMSPSAWPIDLPLQLRSGYSPVMRLRSRLQIGAKIRRVLRQER